MCFRARKTKLDPYKAMIDVRLREFPRRIRLREKPPPPPRYIALSLLRSAYLMGFSLLGREGYRYAESEALPQVREQILKPDDWQGFVPALFCDLGEWKLGDNVVVLNLGTNPHYWIVKFDYHAVVLPCGGAAERFGEVLRRGPNMQPGGFATWKPVPLERHPVLAGALPDDADLEEGGLIGRRIEAMVRGDRMEWLVVDHQGGKIIALPIKPKEEQSGRDIVDLTEIGRTGTNSPGSNSLFMALPRSYDVGHDLVRDFGKARKATTPGLVGGAIEFPVRDRLEKILPHGIGVGSGCVIAAANSRQKGHVVPNTEDPAAIIVVVVVAAENSPVPVSARATMVPEATLRRADRAPVAHLNRHGRFPRVRTAPALRHSRTQSQRQRPAAS